MLRRDHKEIKVNITNLGGRTPLHLAVGKNCSEMVDLLLRYDAEDVEDGRSSTLDVQSAGGWLPLHVTCGASKVMPAMSWEVIRRSQATHLTRPTSTGKTPLIIAADSSNIAVVEQLQIRISMIQRALEDERKELIERRDLLQKSPGSAQQVEAVEARLKKIRETHVELLSARGMRDDAGNIALFNAGICHSSAAREYLAPWNLEDAVRDISEDIPTKRFQAKVVDLLTEPKKIDVGRTTVFDLIYANPERSHSATRRTFPRKPCKYRWVHLPANKRSSCRDIFAKYFIELWHAGRIDENADSHHDHQYNTAVNPSYDPLTEKHGAATIASVSKNSYTVEHFQMLARTLIMQRIGRTSHFAYMTPRCRAILSAQQNSIGMRRSSEPTFLEGDFGHFEDQTSEDSSTMPPATHQSSNNHTIHSKPMEGCTVSSPSLFMYMPYPHFEYINDLYRMKTALASDSPTVHLERNAPSVARKDLYDKLLFTGIHGDDRDYHQRRTLDQFFYRNIATDERDKDQVPYRYQRYVGLNGYKTPRSRCKLIMVDELWMYFESFNTVIS